MAHHGNRHRHLCQQVLDMSKDEGRLSEAIQFTSTTRNTPLEMGKYSHGIYHKPAKDNKLLLHDLGPIWGCDILGPKVVNKYYNEKLQYDRYCDKMLNSKEKSRITNCDILTRKGPITLKVYREDDTSEIIPEFKASDLHLGEWREVVKACPNKKAELGIDLDRPLCEHDHLDRLNDLANKKRKHADDIHDFFRANKRLKLYQGLGLDDHARTLGSSVSTLQVLRRLGSIFTSMYAAVQKLKKKVYKAGKRLLYVKRNKVISLGNVTSKVGIEVHQLSLKDRKSKDSSHLFFGCSVAKDIQKLICRWWNLDDLEMLEGVFYVMWWMIWKFRNQVLFGSSLNSMASLTLLPQVSYQIPQLTRLKMHFYLPLQLIEIVRAVLNFLVIVTKFSIFPLWGPDIEQEEE
ncbi:hypothetical protein Tco_0709323 [Tanacetum coccineum]